MSDRMPAEIWIGGKFPRRLMDEFPIIGYRIDWDETPVDLTSEETLWTGCVDGLLHFCDHEAAYGQFDQLEEWLIAHRIPFERRSDGKYEYNAERRYYRPDLPKRFPCEHSVETNVDGDPVISVAVVAEIAARMTKLLARNETDVELIKQKYNNRWRLLVNKLNRALPPKYPPLPPFELVD